MVMVVMSERKFLKMFDFICDRCDFLFFLKSKRIWVFDLVARNKGGVVVNGYREIRKTGGIRRGLYAFF